MERSVGAVWAVMGFRAEGKLDISGGRKCRGHNLAIYKQLCMKESSILNDGNNIYPVIHQMHVNYRLNFQLKENYYKIISHLISLLARRGR